MDELRLLKKKYEIALMEYAKLWRKQYHCNKMTKTFNEEITEQAEEEIAKEDTIND